MELIYYLIIFGLFGIGVMRGWRNSKEFFPMKLKRRDKNGI